MRSEPVEPWGGRPKPVVGDNMEKALGITGFGSFELTYGHPDHWYTVEQIGWTKDVRVEADDLLGILCHDIVENASPDLGTSAPRVVRHSDY